MSNVKDISGKKFRKLTVIKYIGVDKKHNAHWLCQCDCGNLKTTRGSYLIEGHANSCGQCNYKKTTLIGNRAKNDVNTKPRKNNKSIAGQRFSKVTVLEPTNKRYYGYVVWKCKCDCGNIFEAPTGNLHLGQIKSCGCLCKENKETWGQRVKENYKVWKNL